GEAEQVAPRPPAPVAHSLRDQLLLAAAPPVEVAGRLAGLSLRREQGDLTAVGREGERGRAGDFLSFEDQRAVSALRRWRPERGERTGRGEGEIGRTRSDLEGGQIFYQVQLTASRGGRARGDPLPVRRPGGLLQALDPRRLRAD